MTNAHDVTVAKTYAKAIIKGGYIIGTAMVLTSTHALLFLSALLIVWIALDCDSLKGVLKRL